MMFNWGKRNKKAKDEKIEELVNTISHLDHIVSSMFHEIVIPLRQVDEIIKLVSVNINRADRRNLVALENHFERLRAIIQVSINEYRGDEDFLGTLQQNTISSFKIVSVNTLIEIALKSIKTVFSTVHFEVSYSPRCFVECAPIEIIQCFVNILVNACEAYGETEKNKIVYIKTYVRRSTEKGYSKFVIVEIEDHATGIAPQIIKDIWNEGFSTKSLGKTNPVRGQGLSIVKQIFSRYEGIQIESPVKKGDNNFVNGTKFYLRFKIALESPMRYS